MRAQYVKRAHLVVRPSLARSATSSARATTSGKGSASHDDDAILRFIGRIPVIRAPLASRTWPHLIGLSTAERDRARDHTVPREYRAEQPIHLTD